MKFEIRSTKHETNTKHTNSNVQNCFGFSKWNLDIVSNWASPRKASGFRDSDLGIT